MMRILLAIGLALGCGQAAFAQIPAKATEVNGVVSVEAENFTSQTGYVRLSQAGTSGSAVMRADGGGGSQLNFEINVTTPGTWYFWVRANATADINNGFLLGLDGVTKGNVYLKKIGWSWTPEWLTGESHSGPITLDLAAGKHTLSIIKRKIENPLLDKIVLTRSATPPTGLGPAETGGGAVSALAISPLSSAIPSGGASGRQIAVTATVGWKANARQAWITIVSGATGSANGSVVFNVAANAGAARSGTIVVSGGGISRTCTVNQAGGILKIAPDVDWVPGQGAANRKFSIVASSTGEVTASHAWISISSIPIGTLNPTVWFTVLPNDTPDFRRGTITVTGGGLTRIFTVNQWPAAVHARVSADYDLDGDFLADFTTYQPAKGRWNVQFGTGHRTSFAFGNNSMSPVPADYDGDGMMDFAQFQKSTGDWFFYYSGGGTRKIQFGWDKTLPLPGDHDGDGKADLALYYPKQARWYFLCSLAGGYTVQFGGAADIPVPADYDGDGALDMAVWRPSNGTWYVVNSGGGGQVVPFGGGKDLPVPGDYDGDGSADLAVFRPETATWYVRYSGGGSLVMPFGYKTMTPVPADYDGDGATDIAMYHPASGSWFVRDSSTGLQRKVVLGGPDRIPVLLYPLIYSWFGMI